jgi:glutaredoxin
MQTLILYSKSGCHLCEGLQEKLEQIQAAQDLSLAFQLEVRDIAQQENWLQAYQYEVPVLFRLNSEDQSETEKVETPIPRPSPRLSVGQLAQFLQPYLRTPGAKLSPS